MIWLLYFVIQFPIMLICYITNPIVCLFADEDGELPYIFRMWQTWDDSVNPRCHVMEMAPKFLRYDWDKHYIEFEVSTPELDRVGKKRWKAICINSDFTIGERIRRYLCRVLWLTRNCGYGFAFWCFGVEVDSTHVHEKSYQEPDGRTLTIGWDDSKSIWNRPWWIKSDRKISKHVEWNVYLGWKWWPDGNRIKRCMIANRIAVKIKK